MKACKFSIFAVVAAGSIVIVPVFCTGHAAAAPIVVVPRVMQAYGRIPMQFEANDGQSDDQVKFLSRGNGYTLFLTSSEAVIVLSAGRNVQPRPVSRAVSVLEARQTTVLRMKLVGTNQTPVVTGVAELPGKVHYFSGNNPKKWRSDVRTYAEVKYRDVYPGVNLVYYGRSGHLEYDFVLAPGVDPGVIEMTMDGVDNLTIDARGDLVLDVDGRHIRQLKPLIYQELGGVRREITGGYFLDDQHHLRIHVGAFDKARPLVIDPVLLYSTYLGGGNDDLSSDIAVDSSGNAYVTGWTLSATFPSTAGSLSGTQDAFVTKLNPAGSALVYSTYLGGTDIENGNAIAVDDSGSAWVAGATRSSDFSTTPGALDTSFNGDADGFIAKLDPSGVISYSTYLGGSALDACHDLAVDSAGNVYVTGRTLSFNFPTTPGSLDTSLGGAQDAFVTKIDASGSQLVYSSFHGGTFGDMGNGIAVDAAGNAYITGETVSADFPATAGGFDTTLDGTADAFVSKINPAGSGLLYSTFLGGPGHEIGTVIAIDASEDAYVSGHTFADGFPVTPGAFDTSYNGGPLDVFVTKLNPTASALIYSTYLGGGGSDFGFGIRVDSGGNAYVAGETRSSDFPITLNAIQPDSQGGFSDAFLTILNDTGADVLYSTYLGGGGADAAFSLALDSVGAAYLVGDTDSIPFPTTSAAFDTSGNGNFDVFVAKIGDQRPQVSCSVSVSLLWPPNHDLINVGLTVGVSDGADLNPVVTVSAFSDEDDLEETGAGHHSPDAAGVAAETLRLRSERKGNGDGRVYLVVATATDVAKNVGFACCTVTVPQNQSPAALSSVAAQAMAAEEVCSKTGGPPPGYLVVGDGPLNGSKK